jgi:signal transduction histidine kinase/CheY-like chemotaxis protein
MSGKRISFYILAAFIAGTLVLVYIQYNSSKNIRALISGNRKYLDEYTINERLKALEKDIVMIESNISDVISTSDSEYVRGMTGKMARVNNDLNSMQEITGDTLTEKEIDQLDTVVRNKLAFSRQLLDSFYSHGKASAEKLIASLRGKRLMDSIYTLTQNIENTRHAFVTRLNDTNVKSGEKAQQFNTILIALVLICGAALFWYIIYIVQKLIQSEKKVKEAARIKENFMANMSHEIRTPMNAILGFTNLLQRQDLDTRSREYVQAIRGSGENLLAIINDILDLSKIEAGMMRIESAPFSLRGLVHSVETMFASRANEKGLKFTVTFGQSLPDILQGDAVRLTQILVNLVSNAVKFTMKGEISIIVSGHRLDPENVNISIDISDTGIGIETSKQADIFNRFQQAEDSVTRKYGGTGLGLSIVHELVTLQKGSIRLDSQPGKGSVFTVTIPYKIGPASFTSESLSGDRIMTNQLKNNHILVVEDNEVNQNLVRHLLGQWQLSFDIVANGREAINALTRNHYDLVLMDIQMPEMDGYTTTLEIRSTLKLNLPIIAMTAHAMAGEREKCLGYGMNDYIAKPIREIQLHELISRYTSPQMPPPEKARDANNNGYHHIDLRYMREVSKGNKQYERTVTELFLETIPENIDDLVANLERNNISAIRHLAHNMRTTVSVMGLNDRLKTSLDTLELEEFNAPRFSAAIHSIQRICEQAIDEARHFCSTLQ